MIFSKIFKSLFQGQTPCISNPHCQLLINIFTRGSLQQIIIVKILTDFPLKAFALAKAQSRLKICHRHILNGGPPAAPVYHSGVCRYSAFPK